MKKLVILVLVLVVAAVFWSKKSEKTKEYNSDAEEAKPVSADPDEVACEKAKKDKYLDSWKSYLKEFPQGKCIEKAKAFFAKEDEKACGEAKEKNTRAGWESYLKIFPDGKCAGEGVNVRKKFLKIGNLEWSDISAVGEFYHAEDYCKNLEEEGHTDWRLPNIDELRTLAQNHPGTVAGGKCGVSEENNKLDEKGRTDDCNGIDGNNFSKLGDKEKLWSSSEVDVLDGGTDKYQTFWGVDFDNGRIKQLIWNSDDDFGEIYVRCVRQDDHDACETAKKYNKPDYWMFYFGNFPEGECAAEAKAVWENEDKKACKTAKKANRRAAWEKYLKKFPNGRCAKDGNSVRNKFKKIGRLEWSDLSDNTMNGKETTDYCKNLGEGGHEDWRMPFIDELRMLVQNHPGTVSGGNCETYSAGSYIYDENGDCDGIKGNNFSKFGDKESLWSSSESDHCKTVDNWSVDFSNGGILSTHLYHNRLYVRCVRQDDVDACEEAREDDDYESWKNYLSLFPEGKCAEEAKAAVSDDAVCEDARKTNTRAAWEDYLKKFPDGECAEEGKSVRNKYKVLENLDWSDVMSDEDDDSVSCEELEEDGHTDWREPNIDELRTLVQNNPGTVTGGTCKICEKDSLEFEQNLKFEQEVDEINLERYVYFTEELENCDGIVGDNFSKLGDKGWLDSSSVSGEKHTCGLHKTKTVFSISFDDGEISSEGRFGWYRCVRQDDPDACETAKKYNVTYYWEFYLEHFPNGKCVAEAKAALDELTCEKMKKKDDIRYWDWEEYLKTFPQGKCAEKARTALKELEEADCEYARNAGKEWFWKRYLENFPQGKCAEEAKSVLKELDASACRKAREKNEYDEWQDYLKEYPEGKCAEEANKNIDKMRTIGRLEWSERSGGEKNWYDAVNYCRNLDELGHTDWRLPNIDELRTLIQNCPKTETGGECRVSAKNGCLAGECQKPESSCSCEQKADIEYSKLPNESWRINWLWSSSTLSDSNNSAWRVDFSNAEVGDSYKVGENYVRCVR